MAHKQPHPKPNNKQPVKGSIGPADQRQTVKGEPGEANQMTSAERFREREKKGKGGPQQ